MYDSVSKIYYRVSDYSSQAEMFQAIYNQQMQLTKSNYMCLLYRYLGNDNVYVLEFASLNPLFNKDKVIPCWLTIEESQDVAANRFADLIQCRDKVEDIIKDSLRLDSDDDSDKGGNNNA